MEIAGYLAAIFMGAVLGLVGGGGSILTVPILVYFLSVEPVVATGYSLIVVGVAALFGSFDYIQRGLVNFKVGFIFSLPALSGVYVVRRFAMPEIPTSLNWFGFEFSKAALVMVVFAVIMLLASISMIRGRRDTEASEKKLNIPLIAIEGFVVGAITGFVGAGGGFVIIPALVVLAGLEMKTAVGTSLVIISVKSILGFVGDLQVMNQVDWKLLFVFTALAVVGILLGTRLSRKIPGQKLKPAFGYFVLVMGGFILFQQMI